MNHLFAYSFYLSNSFIWTIDTTLSGTITLGESGSGSDGNEGVLHIPQSFSIIGALPSDCLMSYPRHSLKDFYPSAEMQSVYSTATADWTLDKLSLFMLC